MPWQAPSGSSQCGDATMTITSVNLHFHGTNTSPRCHADEVIHTLINSGETFNYTVRFPITEPPGLYLVPSACARPVRGGGQRRRDRRDRG